MTHYRNLMASCGIVGLLFLCVFLSACAGIIVGGAATSAVVANDPRTTGTFVEDQSIELKAAKKLNEDTELKDQTNINVTSYNQVALVSGQAPTASLKKREIGRAHV